MKSKRLAPLVIVLTFVFSALAYPQLPDKVPSHFGLNGQARAYQPKTVAVLLVPALMLIVWVLARSGYQFHTFGRRLNSISASPAILNLVLLTMAAIHVIALGSALGWQISTAHALFVVIGLAMAAVGNRLRRLKPNFFIGIRTPWTLLDPDFWRKTHAHAGRLYVGVGLLIVALSLLVPGTTSLMIGLVLLIVVSVWVVYYSFHAYRMKSHEANS